MAAGGDSGRQGTDSGARSTCPRRRVAIVSVLLLVGAALVVIEAGPAGASSVPGAPGMGRLGVLGGWNSPGNEETREKPWNRSKFRMARVRVCSTLTEILTREPGEILQESGGPRIFFSHSRFRVLFVIVFSI